ncbi:MAG TPA: site-specific integrase [Candidatus Polarisedimenticolia bacterium]|jgi:integrase|nr:site-specific integrase [Candidatus Polarisedimenticolia bacterium]
MPQDHNRRGLGRIYLRGSTWWIQYSHRGKTHRESAKSDRDVDAARLLKKRLGEIGNGRLIGPASERTTFADLEKMITDDYAINGRKSGVRLQTSLTRLREHFGEDRAIDLTADRLAGYVRARLEDKDRPVKPATVRAELAALKRAFALAKRAGKVADVPPFPILTIQNTRTGFLEQGDFARLAAKLPDHVRPLAQFAYLTGWRISECESLTWRQVDLVGGWARLEPGSTKNGEGRAFPLRSLPDLAALMERQREAVTALERETEQIIPWVFPKPDGSPIGRFDKAWKTARKAAKLPGVLFHDLRRSAVRNLERAGVSRSASMKLTGHKTESVFRRYAIVDSADLEAATAMLAAHREAVAKAEAAKAEAEKAAGGVVDFPGEQAQNRHKTPRKAQTASAPESVTA